MPRTSIQSAFKVFQSFKFQKEKNSQCYCYLSNQTSFHFLSEFLNIKEDKETKLKKKKKRERNKEMKLILQLITSSILTNTNRYKNIY